jgi:SAM-dependent methyltransferase
MPALERLGLADHADGISLDGLSGTQAQTADAFGYKWQRHGACISEETRKVRRAWMLERFCDNDPQVLASWLEGERKIILDAGCGSGYSTLLFFADHLKNHDYLGVDISSAVQVARANFAAEGKPGEFLRGDLNNLPIPGNSVDIIFSEGVLHHTDDTGEALRNLSTKLKPGGRFIFYVYARKAPLREFADDLVRRHIAEMSPEQAWETLKPLTQLGISLGELNAEIDIKEDIPFLGIEKGKMSVQRFFYWYICKAFYRPEYEFDAMHVCNYDWYSPVNCHRHTEQEVRNFCERAGLDVERFNTQRAGFSVVAVKRQEQ